jgi:hypothetical protein
MKLAKTQNNNVIQTEHRLRNRRLLPILAIRYYIISIVVKKKKIKTYTGLFETMCLVYRT